MMLARMFKSVMATLALGALSSHAEPVVLMGDSWVCGEQFAMPLVLQAKNSALTSTAKCIVGSTARDWALNPGIIEDVMLNNKDAKVVLVQLGGNDLVAGMAGQKTPDEIRGELHDNMKTVLGVVHRMAPKASIILNTYVYFPFDKEPCNMFANVNYQGQPFDMKTFNELHRSLAMTFTTIDIPNITMVETYHVFQRKLGFCDDNLGSLPQSFMDCIHPTQDMHYQLLEYIYDTTLHQFEPHLQTTALRGEGKKDHSAVKVVKATCDV